MHSQASPVQLRQLLQSDPHVYLHYTNEEGLKGILSQETIRTNSKLVVYLTKEVMSEDDVAFKLFIGAPTHAGRGTHIIAMRLDPGLKVIQTALFEFSAQQRIRLHQNEVLYAGKNPF